MTNVRYQIYSTYCLRTMVLPNLLLCRTKNLPSCVVAHATANLLLLVYVAYTGELGF